MMRSLFGVRFGTNTLVDSTAWEHVQTNRGCMKEGGKQAGFIPLFICDLECIPNTVSLGLTAVRLTAGTQEYLPVAFKITMTLGIID